MHKIKHEPIFSRSLYLHHYITIQSTKEELQQLDIKTRKLQTASGSLYVNSNLDILYSNRKVADSGFNSIVNTLWCCGVVVITTTQVHSTKPKLWFCACSNTTCGVSEICSGENLSQWSWLEIKVNAFRQSNIPKNNSSYVA